jgi:hypothetical protein
MATLVEAPPRTDVPAGLAAGPHPHTLAAMVPLLLAATAIAVAAVYALIITNTLSLSLLAGASPAERGNPAITANVLPLSQQGVTAEMNSRYFPLDSRMANVLPPSEQGVTAEINSRYFPRH